MKLRNIAEMEATPSKNVKGRATNAEKGKERAPGASRKNRKGKEMSGTRSMKQHYGPFMDKLTTFLTSRAGGKKSVRNAKGISTNVAKYLYWCDPDKLDEVHLTRTK